MLRDGVGHPPAFREGLDPAERRELGDVEDGGRRSAHHLVLRVRVCLCLWHGLGLLGRGMADIGFKIGIEIEIGMGTRRRRHRECQSARVVRPICELRGCWDRSMRDGGGLRGCVSDGSCGRSVAVVIALLRLLVLNLQR